MIAIRAHRTIRAIRPRSGSARRTRAWLAVLATVAGLLLLACGDDAPRGAVHVSTLDAGIGPVTANFIDRALDRAEQSGATAWILQLDTPGGLVSATDTIVQRIEAATVPVVVYVGPAGARAASAGTFITLAAHVAAMAPSTQIGAAHPVGAGGSDIEGTIGEKITNDAAADIRGIAQLRGRNVEWAERAVRESVSATAQEALDLGVIDLVATDLDDLIAQIDGRRVELTPSGPTLTIESAGAMVVHTQPTFFENVLDFIANPNIAFLLLSLGGLALLIELFSPGLMGPGIFGVIMLILAFFSLDNLDVDAAGLILIALAFALFVAEIFVAGFGVLGIGGIIALFFGGLLLIGDSPNSEEVSLWVLLSVVAAVGAILTALWLAILHSRRKRRPPEPLEQRIIGREGITREPLRPLGTAVIASEVWTARGLHDQPIPAHTHVRVVAIDGYCAIVEPLVEAAQAHQDTAAQASEAAVPGPAGPGPATRERRSRRPWL